MNGNINRQSWRQLTQTLVNLYHNQIIHQQLAESVITNASQIIISQHIINVPDIPAKLNLWYNWRLQSPAKCLLCLEICVRGLPPINVQFQHLNENPLAQTIFNLHQQTQWPCCISSKNSTCILHQNDPLTENGQNIGGRTRGALGASAPTKFIIAHRNLVFHNRNISC